MCAGAVMVQAEYKVCVRVLLQHNGRHGIMHEACWGLLGVVPLT